MHWIDRYAYGNRIRRLNPLYKTGFSLIVIVICLAANRFPVSALCLFLMAVLSILWAGLPLRFFLKVLLAEGGFLLFGVLGVAVSFSAVPSKNGYALGPIWIVATNASILSAGNLFMRSLACASALNFLAFTTPVVDLIDLLRRFRFPEIILDLMVLIYRFIFTLMDSLDQMVLARKVRLGFNGWKNSFHSIAAVSTNLFIEAFRRSRTLENALRGRGWEGHLKVLPQEYESLKWVWKKS